MKIIFYSDQCEYSKKMLAYLDKYNIKYLFKLVNINEVDIPKEIDMVPTIIDDELNQALKGKSAFEYLVNIKYFNNMTNNIDYINLIPANPKICEDNMANKIKDTSLELDTKDNEALNFFENNKNNNLTKVSNDMVQLRTTQDSKLSILLKMKRR